MLYQKNLFCSLTFWSITLTYLNTLLPLFQLGHMEGWTINFWFKVVESTILFAIGIIGRYNANSAIYTPKGIFGRDKKPTNMQLETKF